MPGKVMDSRSICWNDRSNLEHIGRTSITSISRGSCMPNDQVSTNLMADLTWADLYAREIRQHLKVLTPAVKRISSSAELTEGTAKLREQLEVAHRTIAALRTMAGSDPRRSK
jgi:hypothetical protein